MFEILEAKADGSELVIRARGIAPVAALAEAMAAAPWSEAKKIGVEAAERTGVRIELETISLNAQVAYAWELRDALGTAYGDFVRRVEAFANQLYDDHYHEMSFRLRDILVNRMSAPADIPDRLATMSDERLDDHITKLALALGMVKEHYDHLVRDRGKQVEGELMSYFRPGVLTAEEEDEVHDLLKVVGLIQGWFTIEQRKRQRAKAKEHEQA